MTSQKERNPTIEDWWVTNNLPLIDLLPIVSIKL